MGRYARHDIGIHISWNVFQFGVPVRTTRATTVQTVHVLYIIVDRTVRTCLCAHESHSLDDKNAEELCLLRAHCWVVSQRLRRSCGPQGSCWLCAGNDEKWKCLQWMNVQSILLTYVGALSTYVLYGRMTTHTYFIETSCNACRSEDLDNQFFLFLITTLTELSSYYLSRPVGST